MKKPIDPNLDNLIDDEILGDNADENTSASPAETESDDNFFTAGSDLFDTANDNDGDKEMKLETVDKKEMVSHHHHHSSGSGDSSSRHSSHSDHSSSGESHHHSSSSSHSSSHSHHSSSQHHSSHYHSSHGGKEKKKMSTASKIALSILIIILILILAVVFIFLYLELSGESDLKNVNTETDYEEVIEYNGDTYVYNDDIVAIAFIGVDKRELGLEDDTVGTAGQADADIVLTIDTNTGEATAIAVPRDTMVDVDLYSESGIFLRTETMQLCLSYAYGNGTDTSAENVTTSISRILYNIPINKYFALDIDGIEPINDAIGGVTLTSLRDFDDLGIKKGDTIHLEGDLTEAYVRTRDLDTIDASLNRTERQVQYIKAFTAQLVPAVMQDFSIISSLYNIASDYSSTDISLSNATYLATLLISKGVTEFDTITLEGEMQASDQLEDYAEGYVYAEFYPDEDKLLKTVLDVFYTKQSD
ncbi:MAG: LCP family protein [Clostridiales bacterium]|nr:LCP family protein [Clostridiales bacterium]